MKNVITILSIGLLCISTAFADIDDGIKLRCENLNSTFVIYQSAAGEFKSQLKINDEYIEMNCIRPKVTIENVYTLWSCEKSVAGDFRIVTLVETGGFTGLKTATVLYQTFRGNLQYLDSLICK